MIKDFDKLLFNKISELKELISTFKDISTNYNYDTNNEFDEKLSQLYIKYNEQKNKLTELTSTFNHHYNLHEKMKDIYKINKYGEITD